MRPRGIRQRPRAVGNCRLEACVITDAVTCGRPDKAREGR